MGPFPPLVIAYSIIFIYETSNYKWSDPFHVLSFTNDSFLATVVAEMFAFEFAPDFQMC